MIRMGDRARLEPKKIYTYSIMIATLSIILGIVDPNGSVAMGLLIFVFYIPFQSIFYFATKHPAYYRNGSHYIIGWNVSTPHYDGTVLDKINHLISLHLQVSSSLGIIISTFLVIFGHGTELVIGSVFFVHLIYFMVTDSWIRIKNLKALIYDFEDYKIALFVSFRKGVATLYITSLTIIVGLLISHLSSHDPLVLIVVILITLLSMALFHCVSKEIAKIKAITEESPEWRISSLFWISVILNVSLIPIIFLLT